METLKIIFLGIFQGVAEFLPISSSGHLAILQKLFNMNNIDENITLDILLHFGTLIAIFLVYYKEIWALICEAFRLLGDIFKLKPNWFKNEDRKLLLMIIIACIPTGILGLIIEEFAGNIKSNNIFLGIALIITSIILFTSSKFENGKKGANEASLSDAFLVGIVQGIAVIPGISRSGSTITAGMGVGFNKELATRFSFFMSMPVILLAALKDLVFDGGFVSFEVSYLYAMIASIIVGYFSIKLLIKMIQSKKFSFFGYYCLIAGIITIFFL